MEHGAQHYLLGKHRRQVYGTVLQDVYFDFVIGTAKILRHIVALLQHKDLYRLAGWVHNPIFPHPCPLVEIELCEFVVPLCGGEKNLNHQVRRTLAADVIQLY